MDEQLKKFYEALRKDGVVPESVNFDTFQSKLQDEKSRQSFYEALKKDKVIPNDLEFTTFQNKLGFQQAPQQSTGFIEYLKDAGDYALSNLTAQWHSGADAALIDNFNRSATDMSNLSEEEFDQISDAIKRQNKLLSANQGDVGGENGMFVEGLEWFGDLSLSVVGSMLGLINNTIQEPGRNLSVIGGATAAGGAGGAAVGAVSGPGAAITATGGALLGFKQGVGAAQSIAAADIEAANHFFGKIQEYAAENNLNPENKKDLKKIFEDKEFITEAMSDSAIKGSTVGGVEFVGNQIAPGLGRVTSKLLKPVVRSRLSNAAIRETTASIVEGVAGGGGEALGSVFIGEEIDWANVRDEALAEILPGGAVRGINNAADRLVNKKAHNARKELLSTAIDGDINEFARGVDTALETGVITEEQAEILKNNAENYKAMAEAAPQELVSNTIDRKEFVELSVEKLAIDEQLSVLENTVSKVDDTLKDKVNAKIEKLNKAKDKINKNLRGLVGDNRLSENPDAQKIHDLKTKTVIAANQLGQPLSRADVSVTKQNGEFKIQVQGKPIDPLLLQTINDTEASGSVATTERASTSRGRRSEPSPNLDQQFKDKLFTDPVVENDAPSVQNEPVNDAPNLTEFESSTDRQSLDGQRVNYLGQEGTFTIEDGVPYVNYDDGSQAFVESGLSPNVTNLELGIEEVQQPETTDTIDPGTVAYDSENNQITAYGKLFNVDGKRYDGNGNLRSITATDQQGNKRTLRSPKILGTLPSDERVVPTQNLVQSQEQVDDEGFSLFDQAEFEILEGREEIGQLEEELSAYAELIREELKNNPEFEDVSNTFTEPFDQIGTASDRGLRGPVARKANASIVAKAILDGKGTTAKKVRDAIGVDTIEELKEKAQRWRDLSSRATPQEHRAKRAAALSEERSNKIDAMLERLYPGITERKAMLRGQISTVKSFLPDVQIRLFESPESFKDVTRYDKIGGFYDPDTNTIYLNPQYANERTVAHEAAHAAFLRLFGQGSRDALVLHQTIQRVLENGTPSEKAIARQLDAFVEKYTSEDLTQQDVRAGITLSDLRAEEYFAELTAILVQNAQKIQKPRLKKLKQLLNKVIKQFTGLTLFDAEDTTINDIIDFMNDLSGGIRKGTNFDTIFGDRPLDNEIASDSVDSHIDGNVRFQKAQAVSRNNGNPMSKTPDGKESKLYKDILALPEVKGDTAKADQIKAQVYSDNFKSWFGDWQDKTLVDTENVSIVVDPNGEPLLAVHYTNHTFDTFDFNKIGSNTKNQNRYISADSGLGFMFDLTPGGSGLTETGAFGKKAIRGFINIRRPEFLGQHEDLTKIGTLSEAVSKRKKFLQQGLDGVIVNVDRHSNKGIHPTKSISSKARRNAKINTAFKGLFDESRSLTKDFQTSVDLADEGNFLQRLFFGKILPLFGKEGSVEQFMESQWAVIFHPNQIKSVFNEGDFSPNNPSIRFQKPDPESGHSRVVGQAEVDFRLAENKKSAGGRIFNDHIPQVKRIAEQYRIDKGLNPGDPGIITKLDKNFSKQIGQAYERAVDSPNDPLVQDAYRAMAEETLEQYKYMKKAGVKIELYQGKGEPYRNAQEMIEDLRDNNHMYIFSTEQGFGDSEISATDREKNMLLQDSGVRDVNGEKLLFNDLFRGVHDYFGHAARGNGFGAIGEENAWDEHVRMFTPLAARAMTAETRGQNSWVNFSGVNDGAKVKFRQARKLAKEGKVIEADQIRQEALQEFRFADQKMTLLPEKYSQVPSGRRFHKGEATNPKRARVLDRIKLNKEDLLKVYGDANTVYSKFLNDFTSSGVTLGDVTRVLLDMDPNMNMQDYINESQRVLNAAIDSMKQAGFSQKQIDANITVFEDVARRWAKDTGRRPEEFFGQIISDFKFVADPSTLTGDLLFDAQNVTRGIWGFLKRLLPFPRSKRYDRQLNDKDRDTASTPFQEDKDLESTTEGQEYLNKNRRVIKGARKVTTDGKAIIYITSDADVKTPVHELAHVYEMYMSPEARQTVMDWTGDKTWSTATSEKFARGFESFLQTKTLTSNNSKLAKVFNDFKNWLYDIYSGRVKYGGDVLHLNRPMRELYANMFYSDLQDYNLQEDVEKFHEKAYSSQKAEGLKYNKEAFDRIVNTHFDNPNVTYQSTSVAGLVKQAVRRDLHRPQVAMNTALKAKDNMIQTLKSSGIADPGLTVVEAIGMADAVMTVQAEIDRLNQLLDQNRLTGKALEDALKMRSDLREQSKMMSEVMSHWRSTSGLALGIGSKLFNANMFTEDAINAEIDRVNKIREKQKIAKLSDKDRQTIEKQGAKLRELSRQLKEVQGKEEERVKLAKAQAANQHLRNIFNIPYFNQIFRDLENFSAQRLDERQDEILKFIDKFYKENSDLLYDEDVDPYTEFVENLSELMAIIIKQNPGLNNVQDLGSILRDLDPRLNENVAVDALNILSNKNKGLIRNLNNSRASLKKEAQLVDKADKLIKGLLRPEISALNTLEKTEKVKELETILESIERLALENSDNLDSHDLGYALTKLKALQDNYNDFMFGAMKRDEGIVEGGKRPEEITEGDVLRMVENMEAYMEARLQLKFENQIEGYQKKLDELDADVQALNNLSSGDFADNPKSLYRELARKYNINTPKVAIPADPDYIKIKRRIGAERQALNELLDRKTKKTSSLIKDEILNTPRALILSADYSPISYQGGLLTWKGLTTNPIQTLLNIKNTLHASVSQSKYDDLVDRFKDSTYLDADGNEVYAYYEASDLGLNVTGIEGSTLEEELQIKSVLERIPFIGRLFTGLRNFSERGYNAYLVAIRLQEYMKLAQGIESMAAKEKIAEYVNTFTGSSKKFFRDQKKNQKFNNLIDGSASVLIAPRLYASTFKSFAELTTLPSFVKMLRSDEKDVREMYKRRVINNLHVLKGQAALVGSMYALTSMFGEDGDEDEMFDLFSSKFMKTKFGQTVISFSPHGLYFRFVARMFAKLEGAAYGVDVGNRRFAELSPADAVWHEFLDTRLNPIYSSTMALAFNRDYRWKRIPEEEQLTKRYLGSILPIPLQGLSNNLREGNWNALGYEFGLDMMGYNSYTVQPMQSTGFQNYMNTQNFNFRIKYPKTITKDQHLKRARFKKMVQDEFATQIGNLVQQGKKPNKKYMSDLKKRIELQVERELR